jgi:hypothetical protein
VVAGAFVAAIIFEPLCCLLLPILLFSACGTLEVRVERTRIPDANSIPKESRVNADVFFLYPSWQP